MSMEGIFLKGAKAGPVDVEMVVNMAEKWSELSTVAKRERLETFLKLLTKFKKFLPTIEQSFVRLNIAGILTEILKQTPEFEAMKDERTYFNLQRTALHVCHAHSEVSETIAKELANNGGIPALITLIGKDQSYWQLEDEEFNEIQRHCVETLINMCHKESDLQVFDEPRLKWVLKDYMTTKDRVTKIAAVSTLLYKYGPANNCLLKGKQDDPVYRKFAIRLCGMENTKFLTQVKLRQPNQKPVVEPVNKETIKPTKDKPIVTKEIDLLLIGKTGNGKSATGNTILGCKSFESKSSLESVTKKVQYEYTKFNGRVITVVDVPGVADTSGTVDKQKATNMVAEAMQEAILFNPKGYHAFLLVVRYGGRFTSKDIWVIKMLKAMFGQDFVKDFCILIMTCGDNFERRRTETNGKTFENWYKEQKGVFQQLLEECDRRIILFNNMTENKNILNGQMNELIETVELLKSEGKRYTNEDFLSAQRARDEFFSDLKDAIRQETLKNISLIRQEFQELSKGDCANKLERLEKLNLQTEAMYKELSETKNQSDSLKHSLICVENLKSNIEKRIIFEKKMKEARLDLERKEEELRLKFEKEATFFTEQLEKFYEAPKFQGLKWEKPRNDDNEATLDWKKINTEFTAVLFEAEKSLQFEIMEKEKKSTEILDAEAKESLEEEIKLKTVTENYEEVKDEFNNFVKEHLKSDLITKCVQFYKLMQT